MRIWKLLTFLLLGALLYTLFFDHNLIDIYRGRKEYSITQSPSIIPTANAKELYKEFECSCCGRDIGSCTCGMAEERRTVVDALVSAGIDENGVRKEMVKKYGDEILFDSEMSKNIKEQLATEAPEDRPIIEVTPQEQDLGDVSMANGVVEAIFTIRNSGSSDLEISGMETSCMCTTVKIKVQNSNLKVEESPIFGMHDNPTDWSAILKSGEKADLIVMFDPNAHGPEATGPVTRTATVFSNDPVDSKASVKIEANVTK